jgi:3-hydroxyisobutyrate dehydrogenase-like beta-hydroxyacid dehydrogenase
MLKESIPSSRSQAIIEIFSCVHLAASAEALGHTEAVGLHPDVVCDVITNAAGANFELIPYTLHLKKPNR